MAFRLNLAPVFPRSVMTFLVFLGVLLFAERSQAQSNQRYRVQLHFTGSEDLQSEVTSYLKRELRRINDVDVVEKDPMLKLFVIAMTRSHAGVVTGYTVSAVVIKPLPYRMFREK